jgi:hypothetical protein
MLQLKLSRGFRKSEYVAIVRADVSSEGKLLATRHFRNNESYVNDKPACPALRALGRALGEDVAEWGSQVRLMECRDGCDGIHPDETIVVGAEVLPSAGQAINAALLDECRWPSGMVDMLVKSVKEEAGPLSRTRLEARAIDIQTYPGRRLLLRLTSVRALGGSAFTGPKWLNMSGELWDGQSMVANFESHTHAVTGHTTCRALNGLSGDTAKLIAHWLHNPTLGAELK